MTVKQSMNGKMLIGWINMIRQKWLLLILIGILLPLGATAQETEEILTMQQQQLEAVEQSVSLGQTLQHLEKIYDANIFYKSREVEDKFVRKINKKFPDIEIHLSLLLEPLNLIYRKLTENSFVVYQKEQPEAQKAVQQETVGGTVTDAESGETLPGVNVMVKSTTTGTSTNSEGAFELTVESLQDTLVFSFVGYQTKEVPVNGRTEIDIALQPQAIAGEELVVVGYGEQRKINLTGSVTSVDMEQVDRKTVSQASQLLAGEISGLTFIQDSGKPGGDQGTINIRGLGTFSGAGNSPLVLIDGIPASLNSVNPSDIENISVLKDAASASIYGSRAANGVILVETKKGEKGEMQVRYESHVGKQQATDLPQFVDSWTYAEAVNEANKNAGGSPRYSQEEIEMFRSGEDPDNYPNKHHVNDLFNTGNGLQTQHNLTFSGGLEGIQYLVSAGYLKQNGLVEQNGVDRYDIRVNLSSELNEKVKLTALLKGTFSSLLEPAYMGTQGLDDMSGLISTAFTRNATVPGKRSDGTYGIWLGWPGPWVSLKSESFYEEKTADYMTNFSLEWDIFDSLKLTGRIGYVGDNSKDLLFGAETESNPDYIYGPSEAEVNVGFNRRLVIDVFANYIKNIANHDLQLLGGYTQEAFNSEILGSSRDNFPTNTIHVLDAASSNNDSNWHSRSSWKLRSFFGRINYSYQDKYLLEGNFRYDGSSRFAEGSRYGLFPSISAGWNISNESFFQIPWIENFKIRGSVGELGNQQIGTYPYQKTLSLDHSNYVGGVVQPAIALDVLPNENITWETTKIINGGLDIILFDGRLNFVVDRYYKKTSDILYSLTVSDVLGMNVGPQNAGEVENRGWDFELTYRNTIGDFSYDIRSTFSVVHNKVISLANVERDVGQGLFLGESLNSYYGYETDGLFVDQEDINNYADQNYPAKPGYIRYKDINGPEGEPDGIVNAEYDRKVLGSQFPKYTYGTGITVNYKNLDLYLQLQGAGGHKKLTRGKMLPLYNQGNVEQWHWDERWTEENPNRHAEFPRFEETYERPPYDGDILEYWLQDASFLRVKNVQLGYNLSPDLLNPIFIDQMRIYISGQNIYTFDYFRVGWDPEMGTSEGYDLWANPLTTLWSIGTIINF